MTNKTYYVPFQMTGKKYTKKKYARTNHHYAVIWDHDDSYSSYTCPCSGGQYVVTHHRDHRPYPYTVETVDFEHHNIAPSSVFDTRSVGTAQTQKYRTKEELVTLSGFPDPEELLEKGIRENLIKA